MREGTAALPHRRTVRSTVRGLSVRLCGCALGALVLSCTDPRARPVAPVVQLAFAASFKLTSPGLIVGSLYLYDVDGLRDLELSLVSSDTLLTGDSVIFLDGSEELTRPINWKAPAGVATGTGVTLVARVADFAGFVAVDSVRLTVQDSTASLR